MTTPKYDHKRTSLAATSAGLELLASQQREQATKLRKMANDLDQQAEQASQRAGIVRQISEDLYQ